MNKTKSIVPIIMVMIVTLIGFTACKSKCEKDGKCEKTTEQSCCKKDSTACGKDSATCAKTEKDECCKKDSTKKE